MKCRNFAAQLQLVVFGGVADTELAVAHGLVNEQGLGIIPRGFKVVRRNTACSVYESGTAWTTTTAYLKCDTGSAQVYIIFFV